MDEKFRAAFDQSVDESFHEGVAEPSNPSEFLLKLLGRAEDNLVDTKPNSPIRTEGDARRLISERRGMIQSIFVQIKEAGAEITKQYKDACSRHGLNPGKVRLYVVGG
jgi:hypothetical protein